MQMANPALFDKARGGDRDAFWDLMLPYRGLIYSVAFGMLRNPERAEDALHEVLLVALRSISTVRDPARLPGWLYSTTRNYILDLQRREERARKANLGAAEVARVVSVEDSIEREEWLSRMDDAMTELPEPFRVILGLKYMNDYSCREIADILEISVSAVKSRLFEARNLLRKRMLVKSGIGEGAGS